MATTNTHTFSIDFKDEETGQQYTGTFTTKRLAIQDKAKLGVRRSQLCGNMYCVRDDDGKPTGQGIDEDTEWLNAMLAHLEIVLVQKPIWWNLQEIASHDLLNRVYKEVVEFENSFKSRGSAGAGSDGLRQNGSGTQSTQANPGNTPTAVVGKEVSASLDA